MQGVELRPVARNHRKIPRSSSPYASSPSKRRGRTGPLFRSCSPSAETEWQLQTLCVLLCVVVVVLVFQISYSIGRSLSRTRLRPGAWRGRPSSVVCDKYKRSNAQPAFNSSCIPTVLASYPGSGSTITRLLIEMTTGVWTGSIYGDESLFTSSPHPFCGELTTKNVVAIKSMGGAAHGGIR